MTHLHRSDWAAVPDLANRLARHGRRHQVRPCRRVPTGMCWVVSEVWG